ncbi:MAG: cytidylate kinase-like family protein [Spirochaetes bacterium]|nr:cytidylate kinase-like family protein [Spirochaetota bacterium]
MGVITISREPCSGGSWIAEAAATELGYRLANKKCIEEVLVQYGMVGLKIAYDSMPTFWTRFDDETKRLVCMFDRVVLAMARLGDLVIVGRGAFKVLSGFRDVLNVRIKAPFERRVSTFIERYGTRDISAAESAIREADRLRSLYLEIHYGTRLDSAEDFDLVLDTGKISPASALSLVVRAARALSFPDPAEPASTASIAVDGILLEAVRKVLAESG